MRFAQGYRRLCRMERQCDRAGRSVHLVEFCRADAFVYGMLQAHASYLLRVTAAMFVPFTACVLEPLPLVKGLMLACRRQMAVHHPFSPCNPYNYWQSSMTLRACLPL
jgi:hypothetical protein